MNTRTESSTYGLPSGFGKGGLSWAASLGGGFLCCLLALPTAGCKGNDNSSNGGEGEGEGELDAGEGVGEDVYEAEPSLRDHERTNTWCDLDQGCPDGLVCIARGLQDPRAYCSHPCSVDEDCMDSMWCVRKNDDQQLCLKRTYCATCTHDSQCGSTHDRCMSLSDGTDFCSIICDPAGDSCPKGSACRPTGDGEHQCFPIDDRCVGDGDLCEPCLFDSDCSDGSKCITDSWSKETFCGSPCVDGGDDCPEGFLCVELAAYNYYCYPYGGTCVGLTGEFCAPCNSDGDCPGGYCLQNPQDGSLFCGTDCSADPDGCPDGSFCADLVDQAGVLVGSACAPEETCGAL